MQTLPVIGRSYRFLVLWSYRSTVSRCVFVRESFLTKKENSPLNINSIIIISTPVFWICSTIYYLDPQITQNNFSNAFVFPFECFDFSSTSIIGCILISSDRAFPGTTIPFRLCDAFCDNFERNSSYTHVHTPKNPLSYLDIQDA